MKTKTRSFLGVLLGLALALGLVSGMSLTAYAAEGSESFTTNQYKSTYTGEHFTISVTDGGDGDGFTIGAGKQATIQSLHGESITTVICTVGY